MLPHLLFGTLFGQTFSSCSVVISGVCYNISPAPYVRIDASAPRVAVRSDLHSPDKAEAHGFQKKKPSEHPLEASREPLYIKSAWAKPVARALSH